jgi:hypothetical protein
MEYAIVSRTDPMELSRLVQDLLNAGYEPYGNPIVNTVLHLSAQQGPQLLSTYSQAVVRRGGAAPEKQSSDQKLEE